MKAIDLKKDMQQFTDKKAAEFAMHYFRTGKGEYGEGDKFIGLRVPVIRTLANKYKDLPLLELQKLIKSKIHEHRLAALLILTYKYPVADYALKRQIVRFYLKNTRNINNWDLVDLSSPRILGAYYFNNPGREKLYKLAGSNNLWERRIAMLATFEFVRNNSYGDSFKIAELLLNDKHDLIHKSVGWCLREIGKKNFKAEKKFLLKHYQQMPRTMLRYAIERFDASNRDFFLKKVYN